MIEIPQGLRPGMSYRIEETDAGWALWTPDLAPRRWPTWGDWCRARGLALPEGVDPSWTRCWPTRPEAALAVLELGGRLLPADGGAR
jgi:hypothetical protein